MRMLHGGKPSSSRPNPELMQVAHTPPYSSRGPDHPGAHRIWTQQDQDTYDESVQKDIMAEVVQSWMDRLQLISLITTFFGAIEAQLLGSTAPADPTSDPPIDQAANAALAAALVVHVSVAILSFLAAFFLIRFRLSVAKRKIEAHDGTPSSDYDNAVWSTNPRLEHVGMFRACAPPTQLLEHCHSLAIWLSAAGFVLALAGIMCFVWSRLAVSAGVFASACMGVCIVGAGGAIFWPASSVHKTIEIDLEIRSEVRFEA